jgi:hypothetical protein
MAPEQFKGDRPIDGQCDVYALGVVLFRMLSGRLPFVTEDGEVALATMHMFKEPPKLRSLSPEISPRMEQIVEAMLVKDPEQRPNMSQALQMLQGQLPFRVSSVNLVSISTASRSGEQAPSSEKPSAVSPTAEASALLRNSSPRLSAPAEVSSAGTITRATGQSGLIPLLPPPRPRRLPLLLAVAAGCVFLGAGGWMMRRNGRTAHVATAKPVTVTANPPPAAPVVTPPPAAPAASPPAAAAPPPPAPSPPAVSPGAVGDKKADEDAAKSGTSKRKRSHGKDADAKPEKDNLLGDDNDDLLQGADSRARGASKSHSKKSGKAQPAGHDGPSTILID